MPKKSAGILLYRFTNQVPEILLVHPGGPFWAKKDLGAWSVPKGEFEEENPLDAALREFREETGMSIQGAFTDLTPVKQKSSKILYAFALEHDLDASQIRSNTFSMEWPPRSGKQQEFPEVDKGEWFNLETAKLKIHEYQVPLIDELTQKLKL